MNPTEGTNEWEIRVVHAKATIVFDKKSRRIIAETFGRTTEEAEANALRIVQMAKKILAMEMALKDAISTYDPEVQLCFVSSERQEAWKAALDK